MYDIARSPFEFVHGVNFVSPLVNLSALMAFTAFVHILAQCFAEVGVAMYGSEPVSRKCPPNLVYAVSQNRFPDVMGVPVLVFEFSSQSSPYSSVDFQVLRL